MQKKGERIQNIKTAFTPTNLGFTESPRHIVPDFVAEDESPFGGVVNTGRLMRCIQTL